MMAEGIGFQCLICSNSEFEHVFSCTDHFVSKEKFNIIQCTNCGFRLTKDFPIGKNIDAYYEADDYISHSDTNEGFVNKLYHFVREFMLKEKALWVEKNTKASGTELMDVGCGTGYFAALMQKRGWNVVGIEKNDSARDFAKDQFEVNVFPSLESYTENDKFDAITLWHVLEHLEDLNGSMQKFHELLAHDGSLFVAVPNRNSSDADKYRQFWAAYDVPRHLWHFAPEHLKLLAHKHGFEVFETKPFHFDGFYISLMSEKYKGTSLPFFKGFLSGMKTLFASWQNKEKSSSLLYILRKK